MPSDASLSRFGVLPAMMTRMLGFAAGAWACAGTVADSRPATANATSSRGQFLFGIEWDLLVAINDASRAAGAAALRSILAQRGWADCPRCIPRPRPRTPDLNQVSDPRNRCAPGGLALLHWGRGQAAPLQSGDGSSKEG